jgi:hypothetical protein
MGIQCGEAVAAFLVSALGITRSLGVATQDRPGMLVR